MQIILYALLGIVTLVLLVVIYNRLYFEINLARATKILNKQLKKAIKEQVNEFSKDLKETLYTTINAVTDTYDELAKSLGDIKQMNKE